MNAYGKGLWLYTVPLGAIFTGTLLGLIKANNPRQFTEIFELMDEKLQYNPEKHLYLHETHTMVSLSHHVQYDTERYTDPPVIE